MKSWFTTEQIDGDTYVLSEYGHWEETHVYLLLGRTCALLLDTGLGMGDLRAETAALTDKPVTAALTHVHWDHIGGLGAFPGFCAHEAELGWLREGLPLSGDAIKKRLLDRCTPPDGFQPDRYEVFRGEPGRLLKDGDEIDIGGRRVAALHTPGHSPGHLCYYEAERGYLFTGDLVYRGTLFADYPSTDPHAYLRSLEKIAALPVRRIFPGHHGLPVPLSLLGEIKSAFQRLNAEKKLCHGSGRFDYGTFSLRL